MEILSSTTFGLLVVTLVTILFYKIFTGVREQRNYWKKQNVPDVNLLSTFNLGLQLLFRRISFIEYSKTIYNTLPHLRYIGTMDYTVPNIIIRDPELIRDVTVKYFDHFTDHRPFINTDIDPLFSRNIVNLRGDRWREMRNTLSPSFTANKMKFMFELILQCSQDFVDYLYKHPEHTSLIDSKDLFGRYTSDVIATTAFGLSVNSVKDPKNEFFAKGKNIITNIFGSIWKLTIINVSPRLTKMLGIKVLEDDTVKYFRSVIGDTLKVRKENGILRPDMLTLLMQAQDADKSNTHQVTVDDIISQAVIFFLGGYDTTSNLISYLVHELSVNQDVQEKLHKEIERCMEECNGKMSYEVLTKMVYMDMVISETLRLYPPGLFLDRLCTQRFEFPPAAPGYSKAVLHPGETVFFPVYALHRDPKYFPDPDKFDPERFNEENKNNIVPYTYIPFGAGPRKCIAERFALMKIKILMSELLKKFVIKPTEKTENPIKFKSNTFLLSPENGFWIRLEKRVP